MKTCTKFLIICLLTAINGCLIAQQNTVNSSPKQNLIPFQDENTFLLGYKDSASNQIIIPAKYTDALLFSEGLGLVNLNGERLYDEDEYEYYTFGGKWGYINASGAIVIPIKYDYASYFKNHFAIVGTKSTKDSILRYGIINSKGVVTVPMQYEDLSFADNNLFYAQNNDLNGIIDNAGVVKVSLMYDYITIENGLAIVKKEDKQGLVNLNNQILIPIENEYVFYEKEDDFFHISVSDKVYYYYHKSGAKFDTKTDFNNGIAIVSKDKKYGIIDKNVKFITPLKYDYLDPYYTGKLIKVKQNNKYGYINTTGVEVIPCTYDWLSQFENEVALAKYDKKYCYIDTVGNKVSNLYDNIYVFDNQKDIKMVELNKLYGVYNVKERKEITPPKYDWIGNFYEDMARVLIESTLDTVSKKFIGGKFGYININGQEIVAPIYSEATNYSGGIATVKLNGKEIPLDKNGKLYIKPYPTICDAIYAKDSIAIVDFIHKGVDLNKKYEYKVPSYGTTTSYPIALLFKYEMYSYKVADLFTLFLENGVDVNTMLVNDRPLIVNVIAGENMIDEKIKMLQILFDKNVNVNQTYINGDETMTPLLAACFLSFSDCINAPKIAKLLIDHGADQTASSKSHGNCLKIAKYFKCDALVEVLKSYK